MKSDKLKKLLKKIKKLRKLKKSKKFKKVKSQNLYLNADIESLKQKIKNQELQLSQMKYPYQAPVSTVSYEKLGIGQQNALNQSNLETIQKNIETKNKSDLKAIKKNINEENQVKLTELEEALKFVKQKDFRQQRVGETDKAYEKYKQGAINSKNKYALKKLKKSMNDTSKETSGVKNLVNAQGTLKEPIYSDTDNQGEFPVSNFNTSNNTPDSNETFDENVEQINNQIKADMNQMDNPITQNQQFIETSTDQNISLKKATTNPKINSKDLNKVNSSVYNLNLKGMNISLGKKEAALNKINEQMNKDTQQLKTESLNLFTDS